MSKIFAVVRPESRELRGRVYALIESLGYERGHGMVLPAGVPDDRASDWANQLTPDLLVLPYHFHRDRDGTPIDGVGVALRLGPHYEGQVPLLMQVSGFSMETRLAARLMDLRATRPAIWRNLVVFGGREIGSHRLTTKILRVAGLSPSSIPARTEVPTVKHGLGRRQASFPSMPAVPPLESYRSDELRRSLAEPEAMYSVDLKKADVGGEVEGPKNSGYFSKPGEGGGPREAAEGEDPGKKSGT